MAVALILCGSSDILLAQTLATPAIALPSGTYTNAAFTYVTGSTTGTIICVTNDGTTPSAAVAGTCDQNGHVYSSSLYGAMEFASSGTYKALATKVGFTNSAIATATYTVVSKPALTTLTYQTPVKLTNSTSSPLVNYYMPTVQNTPSGRMLLFYGRGAGAPDHGHAGMLAMKFSDDVNHTTWQDYAPDKVTRLVPTNIGANYTTASCVMAAPPSGTTGTCTPHLWNGAVPSVTLDSGGTNYDLNQLPFYAHPIVVNVSGGGCTVLPTAQAWVDDTSTHTIAGMRMLTYGSGCISTPGCSITQTGVTGDAICHFGAPVNGAVTVTLDNRGNNYPAAPVVTISGDGSGATASATLNDCEPGDPPNCFWHDSAYGFTELMGGGTSYAGTVIVTTADIELNWNSSRGPRVFRSLDNGANWEQSFNVLLAATQTHSPANQVSIPPGSPSVTGPCAAGCLIQWTTEGGNGNTNATMKSFDDGVNWSNLITIPGIFPNNDEESAVAWLGGMKLLVITRVGRAASNNLGWPEPLMVHTSTDLGTNWTQRVSNLPTGPCTGLDPDSYFWSDQFTKPSGFFNPKNAAQFTVFMGERFGCPVGSDNRWRTLTFDMNDAFNGNGQTFPMPQILNLAPGVVYGNGHTTYSGAAPTNGNRIVMAWEQAVSTTLEDIFVTTFDYPPLLPIIQSIGGGMRVGGGMAIK